MSVHETVHEDPGFARAVTIRRAGIDDFSTIRYIHASAFKTLAAAQLSEQEVAAFVEHVYTPVYTDELLATELFAALLNGELIGTAAWTAGDDSGETARISSVFVNPLFTLCGIGRRLVADAEARARQSGFNRFALRATANSVPFFARLGYEIASYGVTSTAMAHGVLPVTFMRKTLPPIAGAIAAA